MSLARAKEHQTHWDKLCRDPSLNDLPYKVETNKRGQLILTPTSTQRSRHMSAIMRALSEHAPEDSSLPSFAIATPLGVKVLDVVWMSEQRWEEMQQTGDPSTLAPEICVEVMSDSNTWAEMEEKRSLYLEAGAKEVWIVDEEGEIHFFAEKKLGHSHLAPDAPTHLQSAGTES